MSTLKRYNSGTAEWERVLGSFGGASFFKSNVMMNSDFKVWQNGTSFVNQDYMTTADRWVFAGEASTAGSEVSRSTDVPNSNYAYSLRFDANGTVASDWGSHIRYAIEGPDLIPLFGKRCVYSFWFKTNKTGTHSIGFSNSNDRTYIAEFTVNSADTWEFKEVEVPFDTLSGGTWTTGEGTLGMKIRMNYKVSTAGVGTAGVWNNGNFVGSVN